MFGIDHNLEDIAVGDYVAEVGSGINTWVRQLRVTRVLKRYFETTGPGDRVEKWNFAGNLRGDQYGYGSPSVYRWDEPNHRPRLRRSEAREKIGGFRLDSNDFKEAPLEALESLATAIVAFRKAVKESKKE